MNFMTKTAHLKTGKLVSVRSASSSDAKALMDLKRNYIKDTTTIPLELEEYPLDLSKEKELIEEYEQSPNSILILAEINNELIGNIDLTGSKRSKMSHTAMLGMGILNEWRNQGLGRILIESAMTWARENSVSYTHLTLPTILRV